MHRSGVEPEPIAWKAIILPLDHRSSQFILSTNNNIKYTLVEGNHMKKLGQFMKLVWGIDYNPLHNLYYKK